MIIEIKTEFILMGRAIRTSITNTMQSSIWNCVIVAFIHVNDIILGYYNDVISFI